MRQLAGTKRGTLGSVRSARRTHFGPRGG